MNSLKIPEAGLLLQGSASQVMKTALPSQAFAITLTDDVIEKMIQCVQDGNKIQLSLGAQPKLTYGRVSQLLAPPPDNLPYDLFQTKPFESTRLAVRMPNIGSLFQQPAKWDSVVSSRAKGIKNGQESAISQPSAAGKNSGSSEMDSDIETLQKGFAAHAAAQERTRVVGNLPTNKNGAVRGKLLSSHSRSVSASGSPALPPTHPPSTHAMSASDQMRERVKELRSTMVHELAAGERAEDYLRERWEGKDGDFKQTLEKVADYNEEKKKWEMKKIYWKELDVWSYSYTTSDEREQAIRNATKQYDRQRLSASDPLWQKLLPSEDRNKGICLSQLQANIAKGPARPPPKVKVSRADGGSDDETDHAGNERLRSGGESMVRSSSNTLPPRKMKFGSSSSSTKKTSTVAATTNKPKPSNPKPSPVKTKGPIARGSDGRVLSKEIIENSDSSDHERAPFKTKAPTQAVPKVADTVIVKPQVTKPSSKPAQSRPVDEEDSSSSSGTPLAQRHAPKARRPLAPMKTKNKSLKLDQDSQATNTSTSSAKNKNASPTKSSPLASSPPTNVSDLGDETPPPLGSNKRKNDTDMREKLSAKRQARSVSTDVLKKAHRFKLSYEKYRSLHHEIAALQSPSKEKVQRLIDMRDHLEGMKKEIYTQYQSDRDSS